MKYEKLIPGRFIKIQKRVLRIKRRTNGCNGCVLDNFIDCPNINDVRSKTEHLNCKLDDVIFIEK